MSSAPITGRDYRGYETRVATSNQSMLQFDYRNNQTVAQPAGYTGGNYEGKQSLFNRYMTFFYNGPYGYGGTKSINYFQAPGGVDWDYNQIMRRPTAANLINWSRNGKNAIDYDWPDFLWCKYYGKIPNNYMVTLRRFGTPVGDNLINSERQSTPDVGRMITWMDGETNKLEDLMKFKIKLNWKEFKSSIQTLQGQSYGGNGGGGNMLGKILGATDTQGSKNALTGDARNHDPYSDQTNKTLGPINVVDRMMVRDRGLLFEQTIKLVFEYEMRSIDGINEKVAFLDLLSNVLQCTYNRGDFWGGAIRYTGGSRVSNPLAGQDGMAKLAAGDFGGFLDSLTTGLSNRLSDLTGGKGLSLEGIGNAMKSVGGNIASRAGGAALDKMGRPQAQATMALLTGEDTGEWHVTIGNPARPMLSLGNMILKDTEIQFLGPLGKDDFPTKMKVTCSLSPARPRDRDDVQMMFVPNGQSRLYSSALDYIKTVYAGQVGPNLNNGSNSELSGRASKQDPNSAISEEDRRKFEEQAQKNSDNIARKFPNFANRSGGVENKMKWTT